jgi:hypothetical protein
LANTIILKKSSVAGKAPQASDLQVGELAVNLTDKKLFSKDAGGTVIEVGGGGGGAVDSVNGQTGTVVLTKSDVGLGNVANVDTTNAANISSGTLPSGRLTGTYAISVSGNAATVTNGVVTTGSYADPSWITSINYSKLTGTVPTWNQSTTGNAATATKLQTARTIGGVSFDGTANINLPGVNTAGNQNTSGTAANVTGTVAVANGGTGSTTAAGARTNLGATTVGGNLFTLTNPGAITFPRFNANNTVSSLSAADFRTAIGAGTGNGTVTSVGATAPVASSGGTAPTISLASGYGDTQNPYASKTANFVLAAPNGTAGAPTFRAIVAADIPTLNQNTTGSAATLTTARTINGTSFNGSANITTANWGTARTLSFTGDVTGSSSVNGSANVATAMTLANSGVTAGTYGSATLVPVVTVDAKGRVTSATTAAITAGGPVANGAIYENSQTISSNYTLTTNKNGLSAGPITVASGVTVTIPSGSVWAIV